MSRDEPKTVWIEVEIFEQTELAICIEEQPRAIWIPKSQITDFVPVGHKDTLDALERRDETKLEVPEWLVRKNGLDDYVCDP